MSTFNRFLVILLCLTGVIFCTGAILIVWAAPLELGLVLSNLGRQFRVEPRLPQLLVTGLGASTVLIALLVLVGEFSSQQQGTIRVNRNGGRTEISLDALIARLRDNLEGIAGVIGVRPLARAVSDRAVEVLVEVEAAAGTHLPTLADEISKRVAATVEQEIGAGLRGVRVSFLDQSAASAAGRITRPPAIAQDEITVPPAPAPQGGQAENG